MNEQSINVLGAPLGPLAAYSPKYPNPSVHVPHDIVWAIEMAEPPVEAAKYRRIETLGELPALIDQLTG